MKQLKLNNNREWFAEHKPEFQEEQHKVKDFLFDLVKSNHILGRTILTNKVKEVFSVEQSRLDEIIENLHQENKIKLLLPNDQPENQSICWIPNR